MNAAVRGVLIVGAVLAMAAGPGASAQDAGFLAVAGPGSYVAGYTTPVLVVPVGGPLTLVSVDVQRHDIISYASDGDQARSWCARFDDPRTPEQEPCPLFASELIGLGRMAPVEGLDQLTSGESYEFYCSIHEATMKGTLLAL